MKITVIALLFLVIALVAIYRTIKNLKDETIGYRSGFIWITIWSGACFFGIFPDSINIAMELVKMNNRMFFVIIVAVFILFAIVFNQVSLIDNMNRNIRKLVREIAILRFKLEEKKQNESEK